MIPLILWAIKEVAEDFAENEAEKLAGDLKDKILKATGLDQAEVLADDEVTKLLESTGISDFHAIRTIEASVIAKIHENMEKPPQ
jgi:hypothetical protein